MVRHPHARNTGTQSLEVLASELDLKGKTNPGARVYFLPCVAGHVGADAAGVALAEGPQLRDEVTLVVDVGTNAEIILGNSCDNTGDIISALVPTIRIPLYRCY